MKRISALPLFVLMVTLLSGAFGSAIAAAAQNGGKSKAKKVPAKTCLGCHGSYDEIAKATASFKTAGGQTVNPHQYVPHAEKKEIPECTECHKPHPIPLENVSEVVKPGNLDWCYSSCHHVYDFQPCTNCH